MCDIFGKTGGRIGIILENNPAGHCFVLTNLIPMKFFKWVMIAKLKMCPVSKIVGKICLIATRYILFPICGLRLGEGRCETLRKGKDSILVVDDIQQKREVENFVHEGEALPFSGNPNLPIKNTFWSVFGIPAVMIFKMIREYFLSKQQIYSM